MNFSKRAFSIFIGLFMITVAAFGQKKKPKTLQSKDISQQELTNFVNAYTSLQTMSRQARTETQQMLKKNGLTPKRYRMIMMSKRNPKMADSLNITAKEKKAYKKIQPKMMKKRKQVMKNFNQTLQKNNLTRQKFQQVIQALHSDKKLQQRFQKIRQKQMTSGSNGGGSQ